MRIYFTGSHSTGKTTLANFVKKKYSLPKVHEVSRQVMSYLEMDLKSLRKDMVKLNEFQELIALGQIKEEKEVGKSYVSDRCFDFLAYTAEHATNLGKLLENKELVKYINSLKDDDVLVFFIRPQKSFMTNDGVRENVDWDSIVRLDGMIKLLLEYHSIPYFEIDSSSTQSRERMITQIIDLKNKTLQ